MARKKKEVMPPPGAPAWTATFGDLMNLLLCFFVMLFSMSSINVEEFKKLAASFNNSFSIFDGGQLSIGEGQLISSGVSQLTNLDEFFSDLGAASETNETENGDPAEAYKKQLAEKTEATYKEIQEALNSNNIQDYVEAAASADGTYVKLSINGAVLFDSGKAELKREILPILSNVGDMLSGYKDRRIVIEGHTDNVPISNSTYKNNMELSWFRANSVWEYMVNKKGLSPKTVEVSGRGEYSPIADNKTAEGRARNRRVEFKIYSDLK